MVTAFIISAVLHFTVLFNLLRLIANAVDKSPCGAFSRRHSLQIVSSSGALNNDQTWDGFMQRLDLFSFFLLCVEQNVSFTCQKVRFILLSITIIALVGFFFILLYNFLGITVRICFKIKVVSNASVTIYTF